MQLERLFELPFQALADAMNANAQVCCLLREAATWHGALSAPGQAPRSLDATVAAILEAAERATALLMDEPAVQRFSWSRPRLASSVLWLIVYCATGEKPQGWPLGPLDALLPDQRSRSVVVDGHRLFDPGDAPPAELKRLEPYFKWQAEGESGQPARWQGKSVGDGATWPGGLPDFLDDLWTTYEKICNKTGKIYGHDPLKAYFRGAMRETPGERTMSRWLRMAGLRRRDIKAGRVPRGN